MKHFRNAIFDFRFSYVIFAVRPHAVFLPKNGLICTLRICRVRLCSYLIAISFPCFRIIDSAIRDVARRSRSAAFSDIPAILTRLSILRLLLVVRTMVAT